jgi:glycosyl transferase, family 25
MAELRRADLGIWLINLDRDTQRLARMQQQLVAMGLDYTRFAAIDGRAQADELAARVDAATYARNMGQNVTPGHIGCYASHVAVWEQVAQPTQPVALILEDDVVSTTISWTAWMPRWRGLRPGIRCGSIASARNGLSVRGIWDAIG